MIWGTEYEGNIHIVNLLTIKVFIHGVEWVSIQEVLQSMFKIISIMGQFLYMSAGYCTCVHTHIPSHCISGWLFLIRATQWIFIYQLNGQLSGWSAEITSVCVCVCVCVLTKVLEFMQHSSDYFVKFWYEIFIHVNIFSRTYH
jgi:hypothetical protein